jgi:hypothetical protein
MKRSQMLQVIKDALYPHLPMHSWEECPTYIAEAVLQSIEGGNKLGEGMLPPDYFNPDKGGFVGSAMGIWENEWEKE